MKHINSLCLLIESEIPLNECVEQSNTKKTMWKKAEIKIYVVELLWVVHSVFGYDWNICVGHYHTLRIIIYAQISRHKQQIAGKMKEIRSAMP